MYEIDGELLPYYTEIDPQKRLVILDSLPDCEAADFAREVYNDRYSDHERKGRKNIDWWLWRCICLQILYGRGGFFRRFRDREIDAITNELRMNDSDESHAPYLYHEYRNTARRYLSTCNSPGYASRFMGFRQASGDEKILKACSDIWQMSEGISRIAGNGGKMRLWISAFRDEIAEYDTVCLDEYERLSREEK
ncbi:MAG: hypothetical protein IJQ58_08110 [Synergistaceae bacterium]|nr:hypothetical protein [Synergistaceae bacterium]